jgi:hypothetical protein
VSTYFNIMVVNGYFLNVFHPYMWGRGPTPVPSLKSNISVFIYSYVFGVSCLIPFQLKLDGGRLSLSLEIMDHTPFALIM